MAFQQSLRASQHAGTRPRLMSHCQTPPVTHVLHTHTQPCALRTFIPVTMKITPPHMSLPHMLPLYLTPHTTPTACLHTAYAHTQLPQLAHSIYHTQRPQLAHSLCPHTLTLHTLHAFTTVPSAYAIQITFHTEVTAQHLCFTGMSTERCHHQLPYGNTAHPSFCLPFRCLKARGNRLQCAHGDEGEPDWFLPWAVLGWPQRQGGVAHEFLHGPLMACV